MAPQRGGVNRVRKSLCGRFSKSSLLDGQLSTAYEVVESWAWRTGGSEFSPDLMVVAVADIDSDVRSRRCRCCVWRSDGDPALTEWARRE